MYIPEILIPNTEFSDDITIPTERNPSKSHIEQEDTTFDKIV